MYRILLIPLLAPFALHAATDQSEPIAPIKAPFEMPQLQRPVIPANSVNIRDQGAVEGGHEKNTEAFRKAVAACSSNGGGRVVVPAGKWLTGPIQLASNIELHLEEGAEVIFSDKPEDYLPPVFVRQGGIEIYNYSPLIYAKDCSNIAITGPGKLNGNGKAWWIWKKKETPEFYKMGAEGVPVEKRIFGTPEAAIRPSFMSLIHCKNVLLEGFTIGSGPNWTIHPTYSENVIVRRVNVETDGPNNDGIDVDSCRNVLVEYCTFRTGDDSVVLKSGYNEDGRRVGKPTENVVMRHCTGKEGHGGLVIGSEMSGDVRNVYMHDCEFDRTDHAVRIKSRLDRGGIVEKVWVENVRAQNMLRDIVILTTDYGSDPLHATATKPPLFRDFYLKDITGDGAPAAIVVTGSEISPIRGVHFENITITAKKGVVAKDISDFTFKGVKIISSEGATFDLTNAAGITIDHAAVPESRHSFLRLQGKSSEHIVIESSDMANRKPFELADGATESAITLKP